MEIEKDLESVDPKSLVYFLKQVENNNDQEAKDMAIMGMESGSFD